MTKLDNRNMYNILGHTYNIGGIHFEKRKDTKDIEK